jgi:ABC-2 type transport system permease protein
MNDLVLAFRDRAAIILMLLAPFVLTLGLALLPVVFPAAIMPPVLSSIPVTLVNQDEGELGGELVRLFQSADLAELVAPQVSDDLAAARKQWTTTRLRRPYWSRPGSAPVSSRMPAAGPLR